MKTIIIIFAGVLLISGGTVVKTAIAHSHQNFEINGTINLITYQGTNILVVETNAFTMAVNQDSWMLKATVLGLKIGGVLQTNNFAYIKAGCDGHDTFTLHSMETSAKHIPKPLHVATADICDEPIPSHADDFIRNLWLAYASAGYFSSPSNGWIYPLFLEKENARLIDGEFAVKGYWKLLPAHSQLPESVIYTFKFQGAIKQTNSLPPGYDFSERTTNAMFTVLEYTNYGKSVVPTHFTVKHFLPNGKITQEVEVFARPAPKEAPDLFLTPNFPGPTYVSDFRLAGNNSPVTYIATNWTTIENLKQLRKQNVQEQMPRRNAQ